MLQAAVKVSSGLLDDDRTNEIQIQKARDGRYRLVIPLKQRDLENRPTQGRYLLAVWTNSKARFYFKNDVPQDYETRLVYQELLPLTRPTDELVKQAESLLSDRTS